MERQRTLSLGANPAGGTLSGGPVTVARGVATFGGLSIDKAGTGYTLAATSGTLAGRVPVRVLGMAPWGL